jgi:hypothetical protein
MTAMMMERTVGMPMPGAAPAGMPGTAAMPSSWMMVPRCAIKFEKCQGGMKITCACDDATARGVMQNLCMALQGGMCSCCCVMNGILVCNCNLTMGMCKCEMTKDGCCVTCTSGDKACCDMIQSCCDSMAACMKAGCCCCVLMSGTPVCCGC